MRLIIQIPCYNEEQTLPFVIADLPQDIDGIDQIQILVIDDGSDDDTVIVARKLGVHHIIQHARNLGLAKTFQTGLEECLRLGADIIVNTDGDNQYPGAYISEIIRPILNNKADIVIGNRQTSDIAHFSLTKKVLQYWGSWVVRLVSGTDVPDATSGFRALSREAALRLSILSTYTYTLETIIQAAKKGLVIASVPVQVNSPLRESRLIKNNFSYIKKSAATILRIYALYEPFRTFIYLSIPFLSIGTGLLIRFGFFYFIGERGIGRFVQSIVVGGTFLTIGFLMLVLGILSDLIAANRRLTEEMLYQLRRREYNKN